MIVNFAESDCTWVIHIQVQNKKKKKKVNCLP